MAGGEGWGRGRDGVGEGGEGVVGEALRLGFLEGVGLFFGAVTGFQLLHVFLLG